MPYVVLHPVYVRFPQLKDILGFSWSRSWVITLCNEGKFPRPYRLSANRVAWDVDELLAWLAQREKAEPQPDRKVMARTKPAAVEPELLAAVKPELIATAEPELRLEKPRVQLEPEPALEREAVRKARVRLEDDPADAADASVHA